MELSLKGMLRGVGKIRIEPFGEKQQSPSGLGCVQSLCICGKIMGFCEITTFNGCSGLISVKPGGGGNRH